MQSMKLSCRSRLACVSACVGFLLMSFVNAPVQANADTTQIKGHEINFSFQAMTVLDNDLMNIRFAAIAEGQSSAEVSREINQKMQQAKTRLQNAPVEMIKTENYQVSPIYGKNREISHWRGQQTLMLQVRTDQSIDKVLSALQNYLSYQSMHFSLSPKKRKEAEDALLNTAMQGYLEKAKIIARGFGHTTFKMLRTHIQPNGSAPIMYRAAPMAMEARVASDSAPYQEPGTSDVEVLLTGTLLLAE